MGRAMSMVDGGGTGGATDIGPGRRRARRWQAIGAIGLVAYVLLSASTALYLNRWSTHPVKELFPFFSWSLFSAVKNERVEFSILIHGLDQQSLDPPIDMRKARGLPSFKGSRSLSYKALQNVGEALAADRPNGPGDLALFERQYFGPRAVDYEIVKDVFDPLLRWRNGSGIESRESIGRYRYPDTPS